MVSKPPAGASRIDMYEWAPKGAAPGVKAVLLTLSQMYDPIRLGPFTVRRRADVLGCVYYRTEIEELRRLRDGIDRAIEVLEASWRDAAAEVGQ